jgi:hypothetical protein
VCGHEGLPASQLLLSLGGRGGLIIGSVFSQLTNMYVDRQSDGVSSPSRGDTAAGTLSDNCCQYSTSLAMHPDDQTSGPHHVLTMQSTASPAAACQRFRPASAVPTHCHVW